MHSINPIVGAIHCTYRGSTYLSVCVCEYINQTITSGVTGCFSSVTLYVLAWLQYMYHTVLKIQICSNSVVL